MALWKNTMVVETPGATEKFIEHAKELFHDGELDLIKQACDFAEIHYAQIKHPLGMTYLEYATTAAMTLDGFFADAIAVAATIIYPPPPVSDEILDALKERFGNAKELIKVVEEALHLSRFELDPWQISTAQQKDSGDRKDILQQMFLLTIEDDDNSLQDTATFFLTKEEQTENVIRMLIDLVTDIRALLIRLADHLCFIKLLKDLSPEQSVPSQYRLLARLDLAVYAPIADRLGIWQLKSELEDIAFQLLEPDKYRAIEGLLAEKKQEREEYINHFVIPEIQKMLEAFEIKASLSGRSKHIYGIYHKMETKRLTFEDINDLLGIRIIVEEESDCYAAQDVIHTFWPPVRELYGDECARDWIEKPKPNGYRSIHTTVHFNDKKVEIQIRTYEMHDIAEYGVAAQHWLYKDTKTYRKGRTPSVIKLKDQNWSKKLEALRKHLANKQPSSHSEQGGNPRDRIFVITPKGHVIELRARATPLDFAYRIHTDLGPKYGGAKVNGRLVRLDYKLRTGDIVELIKRPGKNPSLDWLSQKTDEEGNSYYVYAQAAHTRSKIRKQLKQKR
jgi:RelA/SpoT family (p)ppGpp synthetase